MSSYGRSEKLEWFRYLLVPFLWILLIGMFVFIFLNSPGEAAVMAFIAVSLLGGLGTWFLMRS